MTTAGSRPTRALVDLDAISANVAALRALVAPAAVWVVVKADGYGHGAVRVARAAAAAGADAFAVAVVEEGLELREAGIDHPIVVLSDAPAVALDAAIAAHLELTVSTGAAVEAIDGAVRSSGERSPEPLPVRVHLKVDTGMHRVGCRPHDAPELARRVVAGPGLELASVWTHLAVADEPDRPVTARQLERLDGALAALRDAGIDVPMVHAANSAGAIAHPAARRDAVRIGIVTYGLEPAPGLADTIALRPALSLVSAVVAVKRIDAGEGVSYGHHFVSSAPTTIATVPVGYADGVPRRFGLVGGEVLIGGSRRRVVGAVTMDQLMVDCGDDPVAVGDEVMLIGEQGAERVGAWDWAELTDTIAYEIVCGIGPRVPRAEV